MREITRLQNMFIGTLALTSFITVFSFVNTEANVFLKDKVQTVEIPEVKFLQFTEKEKKDAEMYVKVNSKDKMQLLANELGVTKSHLLALIHVEAKNHKKLPQGKIPARFERHWMRKCLVKKGISIKGISNDLVHTKRSYKKQKPYQLVHRASKINKECAHYATSWSVFQIMGFNHKLTGYKSAVEMARKMHESPHEKYKALAMFLKNHKNGQALKALKNNDWKGFARSYNGENYRTNRYDEKMMKAYKRIAGI